MPRQSISEDELGEAVANYMAMLDGAMKEYFLCLPDEKNAAIAAEKFYKNEITKQNVVI